MTKAINSPDLMFYRGAQFRQPGYGLVYYRGYGYRQKGRGLGSFFGNLIKNLIPFAKNTLLPAAQKYVFPHAKEMVKNVGKDILTQNMSFRDSLRQHGIDALKGAGSTILNQSGSGYQGIYTRKRKRLMKRDLPGINKRRKSAKPVRKPVRKISRRDIFG